MTSSLQQAYRESILRHARERRGEGRIDGASHQAFGRNRTCGDEFEVQLRLDDHDRIEAVGYQVRGCAITTATASLVASHLPGLSREEWGEQVAIFESWLRGDNPPEAGSLAESELGCLRGLSDSPARHACARVVWETVERAWDDGVIEGPVSP